MSERESREEFVESALAECVESFASEGYACVERVAAGDLELALRLRERLSALARLGLLASERSGPARIGRYRVLSTLGSGGMGSVYLAEDELRARRVAIKVAHVPVGGDEDRDKRLRARFDREMRAAAALDHPGFVRILDVGESDGRPWFAMEHLAGTTLAALLDELRASGRAFADVDPAFLRTLLAAKVAPESPLADTIEWGRTYVETVCRWTAAIADALGHAHAHGVVHRDVKPSNVMIGPDAAPKVFDLGLARVDDDPALTRSGEFAGSPYYVAPEQLSGSPSEIDARCDVYSLGVTLFELLAWRRPFEGANTAQVFRAIQSKEPPLLSRLQPLVPRDLETIVSVALEKDRARRYPSMQEFAADLRRFLAFQPVLARPLSPAQRVARWVRRNPARAGLAGLAATIAVGLPLGLFLANRAIRGEQARTEREATVKTKAIDELVRQFSLAEDERSAGETITARELLDRGAERSLTAYANEPELHAALLEATGAAYANIGLAERAIPLLDRALALRESLGADDPAELARLLERLALAHLARGESSTALLLADRGLAALEASGAALSPAAARLELALADANDLCGDAERAREHFERAIELAIVVHGADSEAAGEALFRSARARAAHGERAEARTRFERALAIRRGAWSPDVAAIASTELELARVLELAGEPDLAAAGRERARA
ncbi:MAG: serine/threonine protein kinase, partial [Planctomycetes bacterium]|nr:serine/threonine protein kinase [Planctomycetota bacterium]